MPRNAQLRPAEGWRKGRAVGTIHPAPRQLGISPTHVAFLSAPVSSGPGPKKASSTSHATPKSLGGHLGVGVGAVRWGGGPTLGWETIRVFGSGPVGKAEVPVTRWLKWGREVGGNRTAPPPPPAHHTQEGGGFPDTPLPHTTQARGAQS